MFSKQRAEEASGGCYSFVCKLLLIQDVHMVVMSQVALVFSKAFLTRKKCPLIALIFCLHTKKKKKKWGEKRENLFKGIEKPTSGLPTGCSWHHMSSVKWSLGALLNSKEAERVTGPWRPVLTTWAITAIEQRCPGPHIWFVGQCVFISVCLCLLFPCHVCPQPADALWQQWHVQGSGKLWRKSQVEVSGF